MLRFILTILTHLPLCVRFKRTMKKALKDSNLTLKERYDIGRKIVQTITEKNRVTVYTYGIENLPENDGYMLCPNHQGRFDGLAMIDSSERQLSFVIDEKRSNIAIEVYFTDLICSKRIDLKNPKKSIETIKEVNQEIKEGKNYCVFPEGMHSNNGNNLQTFKTGLFHYVKNVGIPIIPVCLYDTYKVYNVNSLKKVSCEVHYLKPIYYEEYKDLSKQEIANLVKNRIQDKISELDNLKSKKC